MAEEETKAMLDDSPGLISDETTPWPSSRKCLTPTRRVRTMKFSKPFQTKIMSLLEVSKDWDEWIPAVDAEITSLLEEKEAMEEVSGERLARGAVEGCREERHPCGISPLKVAVHEEAWKKGRPQEDPLGHL